MDERERKAILRDAIKAVEFYTPLVAVLREAVVYEEPGYVAPPAWLTKAKALLAEIDAETTHGS